MSRMDAHKDALKEYASGKGTLHFPADRPLPIALVTQLVKARITEIEASQKSRGAQRQGQGG